ncbi:BrxA/BrxB family bacilliredoxin [Flammeovirga aprica]|uniref:BrxA/BrxB family bacilliredoxin n=1 Tax=Flammeovirga aprica JL-4 TaxID=694437 RepID=A0A7X9XBF1_9BACT|nr:BrxA/BrxB family bacilliredoxin [Flammeovirga aprica]NME70676.1 BrxA/BrxB family bacilliredoxin [Flammeovirga aprica JL-4]
MYPEHLTTPMKLELTDNGFSDLTSATQVEETIAKDGTTLLVINSVCGCAAGTCRPGVLHSLQTATKKPTQLATVFAGVDAEAVAKARELMLPYPPSSPSIALFKDGELVHFIERHHIEGRSAEMISEHLVAVYNEFVD